MKIVITVFVFALATTALSTPWVRRAALWLGFVDAPAPRKLHHAPMPLLGGVAIFFGVVVSCTLAAFEFSVTPKVIGVLLGISWMLLVGLADDRFSLPAWAKLGGQFIAVAILIYFGVRVRLPVPEVLNYTFTFLWVLTITNSVNFLDNIDGLCAGVCAVASSFIVLMAAINEQGLVAALAAAVLGTSLGFLRYNFKPAEIFMGDAGALFLGFLLSILCILLRFPENSNFVTWMVPVFVVGLPLFDLGLVTVSRTRRKVNPFTTAGKDHTSHRLVRLGLSEREAVLTLYLIAGAFGMVGLFITQASIFEGYLIAAMVAGVSLYAIYCLEKQASPNSERQ